MKSVIDSIGNTPLIELTKIYKGKGKLFVKLEFLNPGGSHKDRAAKQIIEDAFVNGTLQERQQVVEMTSGNMGAGLAVVCAYYDLPFTAIMPQGNSKERKKILYALGADVITIPVSNGKKGKVTGNDIADAVSYAKQFAKESNSFYVDQFNSQSCINAHYLTTAKEIEQELGNDVDAFICCVGSGATFMGVSKKLKENNKKIKSIAVEPMTAQILHKNTIDNPQHIIQGTGYGIIPPLWNNNLVDSYLQVSDEEVLETTKLLGNKEGLFVGFSAGANVCAAIKYLEQENKNINVVTILCDTGFKY
jgi:cysteine synthase